MTDEEMQLFVDNCYAELEIKQKQLQEDYKLGSYQDYWYNQETQTLQFKNNGVVELEFNVVFIGTWAKYKNDWLWAWANNSMIDTVKEKSKQIKKLSIITGNDVFNATNIEANETTAWEIAAMAVHVLDAKGMYRSPGERSDLFLAIMDKK